MASLEGRLRRLEHSLDGGDGPPPQGYHDARGRLARYTKALMRFGLGEELSEDDLDFLEHYRDSALKDGDGRLIEWHSPPRSPEDAARPRDRLKESLDAMAEKRRTVGS